MNQEKKLNILFVTTSYPRFSGDLAGCFFLPLVNKLRQNFKVTVLAPSDIKVKEFDEDIVRFRYFFFSAWQKLAYYDGIPENLSKSAYLLIQLPFLFFSLLYNIFVLGKKYDLIITNWLLPGGFAGAIYSALSGKPHFIIEHSAGVHFLLRFPFKQILLNYILRHTDKLILVTPFLLEKLSLLLETKLTDIEIIPMGVDFDLFNVNLSVDELKIKYFIPQQHSVLVFMGRLVEIKGLDVLMRAIEGIDNLTLIVAGHGERLQFYTEMAQKLNLNVKFLGAVKGDNKLEILKLADIVVVPSLKLPDSRTEGAPVIIMEAMATEKIIIASRTGGISYMIQDKVNGLLFDSSDIDTLHDLIIEVLEKKDFYYNLAIQAKKSSQDYDINIIVDQYKTLIDEIINNAKP